MTAISKLHAARMRKALEQAQRVLHCAIVAEMLKGDDAQSKRRKENPMEASNIEKLRNIMDNISRLNDEWFDTFPTDEGQTGIHDALMYEVMEADKILAAPTRNCDRFSNANEALEAFEKEKRETIIEFIRWLFADFAEAKGGAK